MVVVVVVVQIALRKVWNRRIQQSWKGLYKSFSFVVFELYLLINRTSSPNEFFLEVQHVKIREFSGSDGRGGKKVMCNACILICVQLFATQWTVARQEPLSIGFSRLGYWSGVPFPPLGIFLIQKLNLHLVLGKQILYH